MRKKTHKQQLSTDTLLKTKTRDIELTEKELGQVTGGDKKGPVTSDQSVSTKGTHQRLRRRRLPRQPHYNEVHRLKTSPPPSLSK